jgi:aminocarboxymuconate-semialdehyde decarboxylase
MAIDFYGAERVLYGSDNPCWNPLAALEATRALELAPAQNEALLDGNARRLIDLRAPAPIAG